MSAFRLAVDEFLTRATSSGNLQDLERAAANLQQRLRQATPEERDDALRRISAPLCEMHPIPAAKAAIVCGSIVEVGGDPHLSGPSLLVLLPGTLTKTVEFHEQCAQKARADGLLRDSEEDEEETAEENDDADEEEKAQPETEELAEKYIQAVYAENPETAWAYMGEREISLAVIAHLSRSKRLRAAARALPQLLEESLRHDRVYRGGHSFLTKMLMVLDDEPLLILDTDQNKGYRAAISAIPDNFQLHTVLMGHLFGDPDDGWIEAVGFDHEAVRHAMRHVCGPSAPVLTGAFNLWNWTGLRRDGTLPDAMGSSDHWIWNEGVPADIVPFEGLRVVILGQSPYERSWRGGLIFADMIPEFVVQEKLSAPEVKDWFRKLGAAAGQAAGRA